MKSACGREWFVPLEAVGQDYADFLEQQDGLSPAEAKATADSHRKDWPIWFAEQCHDWVTIEALGRLVTKSTLFKTKKALDRRRGRSVTEYEKIGIPD